MGLLDRFLARDRAAEASDAKAVAALYKAAVLQARTPYFYAALGVPDTLDGRFDLIVMHVHLLCRRLTRVGEAGAATAQALFNAMFRDMDRNLREMGVGDPSVPRRIRAMAQAYYGRADAYETALFAGGDALERVVARNVFNAGKTSDAPVPPGAAPLADYMRRAATAVDEADPAALIAGRVAFPPAGPAASDRAQRGAA